MHDYLFKEIFMLGNRGVTKVAEEVISLGGGVGWGVCGSVVFLSFAGWYG